MLKQVCKLLEEQSNYGYAYNIKASEILNLIEELGMRPPYNSFNDDEIDDFEWESER